MGFDIDELRYEGQSLLDLPELGLLRADLCSQDLGLCLEGCTPRGKSIEVRRLWCSYHSEHCSSA